MVALTLPAPGPGERAVRVLVHAVNRPRALTRLRNLGLRAVYLRGNAHPPTPDEITAVLHHPDGLVWREAPLASTGELWHPIRSLLRPGALNSVKMSPAKISPAFVREAAGSGADRAP